ncbi:hypothetical protein TNCV_791461 [Trichonephila clavipes]|nr:hypothetical protein TNCV_791461 [Trichonephila clavipes]
MRDRITALSLKSNRQTVGPTSAGKVRLAITSPYRPATSPLAADLGAFACEDPNQQAQLTSNTNKSFQPTLIIYYSNYWQLLNFKFLKLKLSLNLSKKGKSLY